MHDHSVMETIEKHEHSVRRARHLLAAADDARALAGHGSRREAQELLERELSAQEIADVDEAVAWEIAGILDEIAANRMPGNGSRQAPAAKRRLRRML